MKNKLYLKAPPLARKRTQPPEKEVSGFLMPDKQLLFIMLALMLFGLIFTYSSSAFEAGSLFQRQLIFESLGLVGAVFLSQYYLKLQRKINPMFVLYGAWFLLVLVLFMPKVANVHRWINLGFFNLQPSEVAKPALIIYMAYYIDNISVSISKSFAVIVPPLIMTGITLFLMMLAPELGTPALLFTVVYLMLFVAGAKIKHLLIVFAGALPIIAYQLIFYTYRLKRLFSFLTPESTADSTGYQLFQSFLAIGSGGLFGKGLGNSQLKMQYLPAAHTDFIFAIIAEEIGLMGVLIIIGLFVWLLVRGVNIALRAKKTFNSMLALGLTLTIVLQAFFNMGVATGLLPTKGLPLPFFSYGGSSVLVTMAMMGILFNIAAEESQKPGKI